MLRYLLSLLGVLLALPVLALIALAFQLPVTISGIGYLLACSLVILGLITIPWGSKYSLLMLFAGVIGIAFVAGGRLVLASQDGNSSIRVVTLPQGRETRWIDYIIDEQDSLIFGEEIFHRIGGATSAEHHQITAALQTAYAEIRQTQRIFASPFLNTYLGLQQPSAFDTVIVEPASRRHPQIGIVFLHGYMGTVTAQCWEIAQAVAKFGALTACPSTEWTGAWWQPDGQEILQATFRYLREQGIEQFYLGGFSNGGFGIGRLASKLQKENGLLGLFFINGIHDGASIRETGLPVLIIQGAHDTRVPAEGVRPIAGSIGDLGTYAELPGDHFMIMKQPALVQNAIAAWLENYEASQ